MRGWWLVWGGLWYCLMGAVTMLPARVVVPGNPPLTSEMVSKTAGFYEWALDVRFTPAQQDEYERMLAHDWPDGSKRKSTLSLLQNVDKLAGLPEDRRRQMQGQVQNMLLESFRKEEAQDASVRWMMAIYTAAHPAVVATTPTTPAPATAPQPGQSSPASGAGAPAAVAVEGKQLVGKWRATKGSAVQYVDSATGSWAPTNGSSFAYEFHPDGTFSFSGLMQVTMYSCSTQIFRTETGKWSFQGGDRLTIDTTGGTFKARQTCGANKYIEKPAELGKHEYSVHFEPNPNGAVLVMTGSGSSKADYFRPEK